MHRRIVEASWRMVFGQEELATAEDDKPFFLLSVQFERSSVTVQDKHVHWASDSVQHGTAQRQASTSSRLCLPFQLGNCTPRNAEVFFPNNIDPIILFVNMSACFRNEFLIERIPSTPRKLWETASDMPFVDPSFFDMIILP